MMDFDAWRRLGRADVLTDAIRRLQANHARLRQEGIASIAVFGSVARGDATDASDVDLLVEPMPGTRVGGLRLAGWNRLLSDILGRRADVVVREFLNEKVRAAMDRDLIEAVVIRPGDAGHAA
jgi:predicted nucleotidyltransferase